MSKPRNKQQAKRTQRRELLQPASPWVQRVVHRPGLWFGLVLVIGLYLITLGFNQSVNNPLLPINSVQVIGELHGLKIDDLQQAMQSVTNGGFFSVDVRQIKQAAEQLPWAQTVSVRRVWPDTLEIAVTEQIAVARWNNDAVINEQGNLFYPRPEDMPVQLPQLNGPVGTHLQLLEHYKEIQLVLLEQGLSVSRISYNERRSLDVELTNGPRLLLGRVRDSRDSSNLIARFASAYQRSFKDKSGDIESVDLRYTNGIAIRWKKDSTASHVKNSKEHAQANNNSFMSGNTAKGVIYG